MQGFMVMPNDNDNNQQTPNQHITKVNQVINQYRQNKQIGFYMNPYQEYIPLVDDWVPEPQDQIFKQAKGHLSLPVSRFFNITDDTELDMFFVAIKQRCYNSDKMRAHMVHYLNYFLKYYDQDHELVSYYYKIKYFIDYVPQYDVNALTLDIRKYILGPLNRLKVYFMNDYNYNLNLGYYKNNKNPSLQYTDKHGKILMEISLLMNQCIPLVTHFIYRKSKDYNTTNLMLNIFDMIINMYSTDVDIYSKFYETSSSNTNKSKDNHPILWGKQHIRGKNEITHSIHTVDNIILQIIPKYVYNQNLISYNYNVVLKNIKCQVIDIAYEYQFRSLSNSKRDEENGAGEFDKMEAFQVKQDEALFVQNRVNALTTMQLIEKKFGPFDPKEVAYYKERLRDNTVGTVVNTFQSVLIFSLMTSYFGDPQSLNPINDEDYVKLIISSKKLLLANGLVLLPYIISSKVVRLVTRKNINKKELISIESDPLWPMVKEKYRSEKIKKIILEYMAIIMASEFEIIDFENKNGIDKQTITAINKMVISELLVFVLMI